MGMAAWSPWGREQERWGGVGATPAWGGNAPFLGGLPHVPPALSLPQWVGGRGRPTLCRPAGEKASPVWGSGSF